MTDQIIEVPNGEAAGLPAILKSDQLLEIAEAAEKRVDALKKIKLIALRMTNANDWVDQSGKPWLQESGATKVARVFGISWTVDEESPVFESFEGGHFAYTYSGNFTLADVSIKAVGSRQSKDGFFNTRYKWDDKTKKKQPYDVPPSEIDNGDVKKAAFANFLARGITTILGIKNLSWEEIEEHTNIKKGQVTSIQYGKKTEQTPKKRNDKHPSNGNQYNGTAKRTGFIRKMHGLKSAIGKERYYTILGNHGFEHSIDIPENKMTEIEETMKDELKAVANESNISKQYFDGEMDKFKDVLGETKFLQILKDQFHVKEVKDIPETETKAVLKKMMEELDKQNAQE